MYDTLPFLTPKAMLVCSVTFKLLNLLYVIEHKNEALCVKKGSISYIR